MFEQAFDNLIFVVPRTRQPTLAGLGVRRSPVTLYIDESVTRDWLYIGVLALPDDERDRLLAVLDEARAAVPYRGELHFSEIAHSAKEALGTRWLDLAQFSGSPPIRFHILGLSLRDMDMSCFGKRKQQQKENLYRRFLRSSLIYPMRAFFPEGTVISAIYHDERTLASEEYFDWHVPWRLRSAGIEAATDRVVFVNSDHRKSPFPEISHVIQLIDVILGATRLCLDGGTMKQHQRRLAHRWLPMVERLANEKRSRNVRSKHGHVGRCSVGFFPRPTLDLDASSDKADVLSAFYLNRTPALSHSYADCGLGDQLSLRV